ncbi:Ectonucleoside triphosphate diphosphohydrolase 1 [Rhizophlyctis rosea]|nr:Ectonucleoside triphosphate diphosphohydrolase 1 [Rhizophlyctis rosea]
MMDAGSSGTRLYVYEYAYSPSGLEISPARWPSGKQFSAKTSPGLASLEATIPVVAAYLEPLLQQAATFLPPEYHNHTSIYLKATGGMRLLAHPKKMLNAVRAVLGDAAFCPFRFSQKNHASIISGEHEGMYAWLTVNHLLGHLYSPKHSQSAVVMDLGGASTQIAFEPEEIPLASHYSVSTHSIRHEIYTHSYLRFGMDEARRRLFAEQMNDDHEGIVEDPCGWKGYNTTLTSLEGKTLLIQGTGSFERCHHQIEDYLLGLHTFCPAEPCGINGVYQAPIPPTSPIYAISAFAFTAQFFSCTGHSNISCLLDNASTLCSQSNWQTIQTRYPDVPKAFLPGYCFGAAYVAQVLVSGYGVGVEKGVYFGNGMEDGTEISWTLGAAIYEIGARREGEGAGGGGGGGGCLQGKESASMRSDGRRGFHPSWLLGVVFWVVVLVVRL